MRLTSSREISVEIVRVERSENNHKAISYHIPVSHICVQTSGRQYN